MLHGWISSPLIPTALSFMLVIGRLLQLGDSSPWVVLPREESTSTSPLGNGQIRRGRRVAPCKKAPRFMFWIISGPSSVGKSTFIESPRLHEITGLCSSSTPVKFAWNFSAEECASENDILFHYNILRPPDLIARRNRDSSRYRAWLGKLVGKTSSGWRIDPLEKLFNRWNYQDDDKWDQLSRSNFPKRAIVLVASRHILLQRVENRLVVENHPTMDKSNNVYDSKHWRRIYETTDLVTVYRKWCRELSRQRIGYILIDSTSFEYRAIKNIDQLSVVVRS